MMKTDGMDLTSLVPGRSKPSTMITDEPSKPPLLLLVLWCCCIFSDWVVVIASAWLGDVLY